MVGGVFVNIEFDLTKEDYFRYYLYVHFRKGKLRTLNIVILLLSILGLITMTLHYNFDLTKLFVVILLFLLICLVLMRVGVSSALSSNGTMINHYIISIDPQAVTEKIRYRTTTIEWGGVRDVVDDSSNIYFFLDNGLGCIIPKRSFTNSEEALKFLRLATSYWTSTK